MPYSFQCIDCDKYYYAETPSNKNQCPACETATERETEIIDKIIEMSRLLDADGLMARQEPHWMVGGGIGLVSQTKLDELIEQGRITVLDVKLPEPPGSTTRSESYK